MRGIPVHGGDAEALEEAIHKAGDCCIVLLETPANPTLMMTDIERVANAAAGHPAKPVVMVDNTFLGPVFQHPLLLGADIVLYSATKYLGGFSDMLAGVALAKSSDTIQKIRSRRNMFGNILPPDECWMLDSRLPTVSLRMNRQSKNAQRLAEALVGHRQLSADLLSHAVHRSRSRSASSKNSARIRAGSSRWNSSGGKPAAFDFLRKLRIARNAVSLGGVETLVCHPKSTTHSGMTLRRNWRECGRHRRAGARLRRHRRLARSAGRFRAGAGGVADPDVPCRVQRHHAR